MASSAVAAPSKLPAWGQTGPRWHPGDAVERWLEAERDQLALWLPVALGGGVTAWLVLPDPRSWAAAGLACVAVGLGALALGRHGRLARLIGIGGLTFALGLALMWWRAERVAAPVLGGPTIARFTGVVEAVEPLAARELVRLTLRPQPGAADDRGDPVALPPRVRVNLQEADAPAVLGPGGLVSLRARLMPPPTAAVPGAYDYARRAWFDGIGATGRGFAPVAVLKPGMAGGGLRAALLRRITERLPGSGGGIAAALATGDTGAIGQEDADAMRRAGLAHLLAVSGLHITTVVGATMLVVLRLLALSPWLALRVRLPLVAGVAGAAAAIGYTLLTGAHVPTIRACAAALLVLAALALGRETVTLRLVATGALVVLFLQPEAVAGPSFQLSFAAITAIVALHENKTVAAWFERRDEARWRRWGRGIGSLLLTGLVVELALMPISVWHFHRAGVYGALANVVAIPLTTTVVMPLEALAVVLDPLGVAGPAWWLADKALALLLLLAHAVAAAPGSVAALSVMPAGAFAAMVTGGLWIALWRTGWRRLGVVPLAVGAVWAILTPGPDLLVTGDARHLAIRTADGGLALLRDRAGDYTRSMLAETGGIDGELPALADQAGARCSEDLCLADVAAGGRRWRVLATRSTYPVPVAELVAACRTADVVVSERWLPRGCAPRWLRLDRPVVAGTGGVAIDFAAGTVRTVLQPGDRHPWRVPEVLGRSGGAARERLRGRGANRYRRQRRWTRRARASREVGARLTPSAAGQAGLPPGGAGRARAGA